MYIRLHKYRVCLIPFVVFRWPQNLLKGEEIPGGRQTVLKSKAKASGIVEIGLKIGICGVHRQADEFP